MDKAAKDAATPLCIAALKGYGEVVEELVKAGRDVDKVRNDGTALLLAAYQGHDSKVVTALVKGGHGMVVEALIKGGCDIDKATNG